MKGHIWQVITVWSSQLYFWCRKNEKNLDLESLEVSRAGNCFVEWKTLAGKEESSIRELCPWLMNLGLSCPTAHSYLLVLECSL